MEDEIEESIRKKIQWPHLSANVKRHLSDSPKKYERYIIDFSTKSQLRFKGSLVKTVCKDERKYYEALIQSSIQRLMVFPYHLADMIVKDLRITPYIYYVEVVALLIESEKSYDTMPNFTAADCLRLLGIGGNEYLELIARSRSLGWRGKSKAIRSLLPKVPCSVTVQPWWRVELGYVLEEDVKPLCESEKALIELLIERGSQIAGTLDYNDVNSLYRRGLIYLDVPIATDDKVSVQPLKGFVMNRIAGDYFETLLEKVFVSIDEHTTVAELANVLQVEAELVKQAVSLYCRLGFAHSLHPPRVTSQAADSKNIKKLSPELRKTLARLKDAKQVGNYKLPDAPTSKGKGEGKKIKPDHRQWISCPLLPGVPSIPPPRIPQPWKVLRSNETTAAAEDVDDGDTKGTPTLVTLQGPFPETTATAEDNDATAKGTPTLVTLQGPFPETTASAEDGDDGDIKGTPTLLTLQEPLLGLTNDKRTKRLKEMDIDDTPTVPRAKNRRIQLSPSTRVIQATELPAIPVLADIEFINFSPNIDIERNCGSEADSGSEIEMEEHEDLVDISLCPLLNLANAIVEDLDEPIPTEAMELVCRDADEDQVIRDMATGDEDVLRFDWCSEYTNFEGVREEFAGPSGPTFDHSGMSPLQILKQIWDTSIIDHIVRETNKYASNLQSKRARKLAARISRWKDTTREEIWSFLSILMLQSLIVNNVEREYWYPSNDHLRIGNFGKIMPYNRFILIKRCLHFVDNSTLPEHPSKLDKIMPIITHLNKKFATLYLPEQNVAIDESLLLWKGRLSFSQRIATKRAREGIKSFEICESRTGYLWKMEVYSGKGHIHAPQEAVAVEGQNAANEPDNATSQIVINLMRPLFGKGHTLVMDNYYNSPLLSRLLKAKHRTDTMGTLRLNREFVPVGLKAKTKKNMKTGEVCFSSTKDLCVLVYMDRNIVSMISTFHQPEVGGKVKHGYYKYKPKVVLDYNLSMGGIDRKDQLLSSYPIERTRNLSWYKKLFRRLLNVSLHNASVIYDHGRTGSDKLGNRPFRLQLINEMLDVSSPLRGTPQPPQPQPELSQMHIPVKVKKQRCKWCYQNKVRRTTVWSCGTCRIYLCIDGCYAEYHKQLCQ